MKLRFIHIADVHLGMCPESKRGFGDFRKIELQETFFRLLLEGQKQKVDFIFIAGDLFHYPPAMEELQELNGYFKKISPIQVVLIGGNHDYIKENGGYERFPFVDNVTLLKKQSVDKVYFPETQTTVWGFSYDKQEIRERKYDKLKPEGQGYHILLAHGGDETHIPMDYEALKWSGFDYIALGHIHKPQVIVQDFMNYAGSLEPLDRTEKGEHGYFLGEILEESQRVTFVPFSKRQYKQVDIVVEEDSLFEVEETIRKRLEKEGEQHFYEITLLGDTKLSGKMHFDKLERDYFVLSMEDKTRKNYSIQDLYEANKENVVGYFIQQLKHSKEPFAHEALEIGIEALLETKKPF